MTTTTRFFSDTVEVGPRGSENTVATYIRNAAGNAVGLWDGGTAVDISNNWYTMGAGLSKVGMLSDSIGATPNNMVQILCYSTGQRFEYFDNKSVPGYSTQQIIDNTLLTISDSCRLVFVMEGANDSGGSVTAVAHRNNIATILQSLKSRGIMPAFIFAPPTTTNPQTIDAYNARDFIYCLDNGIIAFDPWLETVDVANGQSVGGSFGAGIHPSIAQHNIAGTNLASSILNLTQSTLLPRHNIDNTGIFTNVCHLTDTNTDGVADGWTAVGGDTSGTLTAGTGAVRGKWQDINISGTAAQGYAQKVSNVGSGWSVGDELLVVCRVKVNSASNAKVSVYIQQTPSSTRKYIVQDLVAASSEFEVGIRFTPITGTTQFGIYAAVANATSGAYSGSVSIAQLNVLNLTTLRA